MKLTTSAKSEIKINDPMGQMVLDGKDSEFVNGVVRQGREFRQHPDHPNTIGHERAIAERLIDRRMNRTFLKEILTVVQRGHFNIQIRELLIGIATAEDATEMKKIVQAMPDRTVCGAEEGWVLAALLSFCRHEAQSLWHFRMKQREFKYGFTDEESAEIEAKHAQAAVEAEIGKGVRA